MIKLIEINDYKLPEWDEEESRYFEFDLMIIKSGVEYGIEIKGEEVCTTVTDKGNYTTPGSTDIESVGLYVESIDVYDADGDLLAFDSVPIEGVEYDLLARMAINKLGW